MKNLLTFLPAFLIASTVVAEPTEASHILLKTPTATGYTSVLVMPDGSLERVEAFTTVNTEKDDEGNLIPYTWTVPANIKGGTIDYLVVAGGGGGGSASSGGGGGGGAGGMLTGVTSISANTDLNIVVGAGGSGATGGGSTLAKSGADSSITVVGQDAIIAYGGGAGGSAISKEAAKGSDGGSGGGGAGTSGSLAKDASQGGAGIPDQGNNGGNRTFSTSSNAPGAGGGGAGKVGTSVAGTSSNGHGGDGCPSLITGLETWYAGGGGGGSYNYYNTYRGNGGKGGGGKGGGYNDSVNSAAYSGAVSTGGGGGGGRGSNRGGNGGSGIVVLRYALTTDSNWAIVIEGVGESYEEANESLSDSFDVHSTLRSDKTYTCLENTYLNDEETIRVRCTGWKLYRHSESEPFRSSEDSGESSTQVTLSENDTQVVLKWFFVKEYKVTATAAYASSDDACTRGSVKVGESSWGSTSIGWYQDGDEVIISASQQNFIGWGGWGTSADRSLSSTKTFIVNKAPILTTVAYYTADDKDNIVLNGDFEKYNLSKYQNTATIQPSFDWLTAGNWECIQYYTAGLATSTSNQYRSGLLSATESTTATYSSLQVLEGMLSGAMGSKPPNNSNHKNPGTIYCNINVSSAGIYDLSFIAKPASSSTIKGESWQVNVYLKRNDIEENVFNIDQVKASSQKQLHSGEITINEKGIYTLIIRIDKDKISPTGNINVASAVDNISLCLRRGFGFAIKVR